MHIHECKLKTQEELQELDSMFLISSYSHSKLKQYSRNQKAFEMLYIYNFRAKASATTIAGQAYHYALERFFKEKKDGIHLSIIDLEMLIFNFIDEQKDENWKLQKMTPTIEECKIKATDSALKGIRNFYSEIDVYLDEIDEISEVELYFSEFLTINGVDIPMRCNGKIDIKFRSKQGKMVLGDHKLRSIYTPEEEIALTSGSQAVIYSKGSESLTGQKVDEVWFFENKIAKNKDNSPQIQVSKIKMNPDTIRLYESLVYEPLRAVLKATSDPDHVYLINDSDNFVDMAEIYDFWGKTIMGEMDGCDIEESKRELIEKRTKKIRDASINVISPKVIKDFRKNASKFIKYDMTNTDMTTAEKIEHVLKTKQIHVSVAHELSGYSSNTYLLEFSAGTNISSIYSKRLDIANALNVANVRIPQNLQMYNDKSYMGIETAKKRNKDLIWDAKYLEDMKIPIGIDNMGDLIFWNLKNESTANKFTSGSVGAGKSANIISDLEYVLLLKEVKRISIFDPKREFLKYSKNKKVTVYNDYLEMELAMKALVDEMDEKIKQGVKEYVYVIIDEYADILGNTRKGKELDKMEMVQDGFYAPKKMMGIPMPPEPKMKLKKTGQIASFEENFMKLAQKGRSSGFRIDAATQISTADVLTSKIKVNFPVIVCFRMPKEANSRVALDESGAEMLTGAGDGLIKSPDFPEVTRFQAFYKPD